MSWTSGLFAALLALLLGCSGAPAVAAEVCPIRSGQPVRFVDVFDGPPQELATLVPDVAQARSGYWQLGYVYEAGRVVTIRCKYADGQSEDVTLSKKVQRCNYKINAQKKLTLNCK
jgi:hypothetical protein